jgi:hypothetical protein
MDQTILTQFSQISDVTSTINVPGRGYVHCQFRVGSAISNPSVVLSTMSMIIALQRELIGGESNMWADVETWTIALTESMPGRDLAYLNAEQDANYRLYVKHYGSGRCQARLWGG